MSGSAQRRVRDPPEKAGPELVADVAALGEAGPDAFHEVLVGKILVEGDHGDLPGPVRGIEPQTAEIGAVFLGDFVHLDPLHDGHGAGGRVIGLAGAGRAVEDLVEWIAPLLAGGGHRARRWAILSDATKGYPRSRGRCPARGQNPTAAR